MKTLVKIITATLIVSSVFVLPQYYSHAQTTQSDAEPVLGSDETAQSIIPGNCYCIDIENTNNETKQCTNSTPNLNCWNTQKANSFCYISYIHQTNCTNEENKTLAKEQKGNCKCTIVDTLWGNTVKEIQDATPENCAKLKKEMTEEHNEAPSCKLRYLKPSEGKGNCYCIENKEPFKATDQCFNNITIEECHNKSNTSQTCFLDPTRLTQCDNSAVQASALITKGDCQCKIDGNPNIAEYPNETAQKCAFYQAKTENAYPNQNAQCTLTPSSLNECTCVLFDDDILFDDFTHTSVEALSPAICNSKSVTDRSFEYENDKWNAMCVWGPADINELKETLEKALDNNATNQDIQQLAAQVDAPQFFPAPKLNVPIPGMKKLEPLNLKNTDTTGAQLAWIPQYISAIYIFGVGLATIIATVTILIGGIYILTAGGQSGRVSTGQELIKRSIIGLVLAMGSYFILYTINPETTTLKILNIQTVESTPIPDDFHAYDAGAAVEPNTNGMSGNVGQAAQYDCSSYPNTGRGRYKCLKDCVAALPLSERTKIAKEEYRHRFTGHLDCLKGKKKRRNLKSIKRIVIHEGRLGSGTIGHWWKKKIIPNPKTGKTSTVGTHYFVGRGGEIWQIADESFVMYHSAKSGDSIGIDIYGDCTSAKSSPSVSKKCNYTDAQYNSLKKLIKDIQTRTSVVYDSNHIMGHCEVNPIGSGHVDPRNFDWTKLGLKNEDHHVGRCIYVPGAKNFPEKTTATKPPKK